MKLTTFLKNAWGGFMLLAWIVLATPSAVWAQCSAGSGPNPPQLSAGPTSVLAGSPVSLSWSGPSGGACTITSNVYVKGLINSQPASGQMQIYPTQTVTITANCGGPQAGGGCAFIKINVTPTPPPTATPTPTPTPTKSPTTGKSPSPGQSPTPDKSPTPVQSPSNGGGKTAPTANAGGPYFASLGEAITFDGSQSTASSGTVQQYIWDFGDGSYGQGKTTSHTYSPQLPPTPYTQYTVKLTVIDSNGLASTPTQTTAVILSDPSSLYQEDYSLNQDAFGIVSAYASLTIINSTIANSFTPMVKAVVTDPLGNQTSGLGYGPDQPFVYNFDPIAGLWSMSVNFYLVPVTGGTPILVDTPSPVEYLASDCGDSCSGDQSVTSKISGPTLIPTPPPPAGTTNATVSVSIAAGANMTAGKKYPATITVTNTGTAPWNAIATGCNNFLLGSENDPDNSNWGTNRLVLPNTVAPGASLTFSVVVKAPDSPGVYNYQWQMLQECVGRFGTPSVNIPVAVNALPTNSPIAGQLDISDFNGDGKSDILLQKSDGTAAVWLQSGGTVIGGQYH